MENQQLVSPSRQCSNTPVAFGQVFLSKKQSGNTAASPDLVPADIYLFPVLKSVLREWRFCDATDVVKNTTEELKSLSRNGFQECFQQLYTRWRKCIFAQRGYFERNVA
jgi:hypothetical protein